MRKEKRSLTAFEESEYLNKALTLQKTEAFRLRLKNSQERMINLYIERDN
jgi:hypothetical protein